MDVDIPFLGGAYCVILMVLGQFFLMNLILAVIIFAFIKSQKEALQNDVKAYQQEEEVKEQQKQMKDNIKNSIVSIMHTNNDYMDSQNKKSAPNINIARISRKDLPVLNSLKNVSTPNES